MSAGIGTVCYCTLHQANSSSPYLFFLCSMTCAKCNHGFCWRCLKPWKPTHKDYYNCSAMVSVCCMWAVWILLGVRTNFGTLGISSRARPWCGAGLWHLVVVGHACSGPLVLTPLGRSPGNCCLSLQVSKAARQEKRFQDYNERCTFHHQARVRALPATLRAQALPPNPRHPWQAIQNPVGLQLRTGLQICVVELSMSPCPVVCDKILSQYAPLCRL